MSKGTRKLQVRLSDEYRTKLAVRMKELGASDLSGTIRALVDHTCKKQEIDAWDIVTWLGEHTPGRNEAVAIRKALPPV